MTATRNTPVSPRRIALVIVHYGDPERTVQAVMHHWGLDVFAEVIVVANDLLRRPAKLADIPCKWLIPDRNLGYGAACQYAAEQTSADIYGFFNAHITISKDSVDRCLEAFDANEIGVVAPCSYYPLPAGDEQAWRYAYGRRTYTPILGLPVSLPSIRDHREGEADKPELMENDWASGGDVFCRKDVITDIGWDGSYFLTVEDVDICLRAKKSGWRVVAVRSAIAFHTGQSTRTSATSSYYGMRNSLWFTRRHRGRRTQVLVTAYLICRLLRVGLADIVKRRRPPHAKAAACGLWDGWRLWASSAAPLPGEPLWPREHHTEKARSGLQDAKTS